MHTLMPKPYTLYPMPLNPEPQSWVSTSWTVHLKQHILHLWSWVSTYCTVHLGQHILHLTLDSLLLRLNYALAQNSKSCPLRMAFHAEGPESKERKRAALRKRTAPKILRGPFNISCSVRSATLPTSGKLF